MRGGKSCEIVSWFGQIIELTLISSIPSPQSLFHWSLTVLWHVIPQSASARRKNSLEREVRRFMLWSTHWGQQCSNFLWRNIVNTIVLPACFKCPLYLRGHARALKCWPLIWALNKGGGWELREGLSAKVYSGAGVDGSVKRKKHTTMKDS